MSDICGLIWCALIGLFRSRAALEAEILVLRQQLNVLRPKSSKRVALGNVDRLVFVGLYRLAPGIMDALKILKPETVIRWHRWIPRGQANHLLIRRPEASMYHALGLMPQI